MAARQFKREELRVDDKKVGVQIWPGQGRPLIMLHGFMDSSPGFDNMARHTHRPCYAFDLPGFGRSQIPDRPELAAYAERICEAARQLDVGKAIWVGHSMGGAVARAAADNPENHDLIEALALITPAGFGPLPLATLMDRPLLRPLLTAAFPVFTINPLSTLLAYSTQVSGGISASGPMVLRTMRSAVRGPQGPGMAAHALNSVNHIPEQELYRESSFKGPVASLWGERDRLIPISHAAGLRRVFPGAGITVWSDLAHHPQREQPRRLQVWVEKSATRSRGRKGSS